MANGTRNKSGRILQATISAKITISLARQAHSDRRNTTSGVEPGDFTR